MKRNILVVTVLAGMIGLFTAVVSAQASAFSSSQMKGIDVSSDLVQQVSFRCEKWRRLCSLRWGPRSHEYRRCMRRHECGRDESYRGRDREAYRSCRRARNVCSQRWRWGSWEFRRCLRRQGCGY